MLAIKNAPSPIKNPLMTIGGVLGFFTPTLKFHYDPNHMQQFTRDPSMQTQAYYTDQPVSALHLGITGSLIYGCNSHLIGRIKNNPAKVLLGAV